MELPAKYDPALTEDKWYAYWLENKFFHSEPDEREPYTIVIPPPNVTGILHMGHVLNNTLNDVLVRKARMDGKNACWVPGTDHASIATENKVVQKLAAEGIKKEDLTREEFLKHAWDWTHKHGGIILEQLKKLGASCDWSRTAFTMDELRSQSVIKVFVDLYNKGLIYRGLRMVNWDPKAQTALSNEEVIYKDEKSKLYYLRYYVEETPGCTDGEEAGAVTLSPADAFQIKQIPLFILLGCICGVMSYYFTSANAAIGRRVGAVKSQYKILEGRWPKKYNEVILILPSENEISDLLLYSLGLRDGAELKSMMSNLMAGESVEVTNKPLEFTYKELMETELKLINATDKYRYNSSYGIYEDMSSDEAYMQNVYGVSQVQVQIIRCNQVNRLSWLRMQ